MTLAENFENFYSLPNSILNFGKVTTFGGNWLKYKQVTGKKLTQDGKHLIPPPPVLIGLRGLSIRVYDFLYGKFYGIDVFHVICKPFIIENNKINCVTITVAK